MSQQGRVVFKIRYITRNQFLSRSTKKELLPLRSKNMVNSWRRPFPKKLKLKWFGLFEVVRMIPQGAVGLWHEDKSATFMINRQRVEQY